MVCQFRSRDSKRRTVVIDRQRTLAALRHPVHVTGPSTVAVVRVRGKKECIRLAFGDLGVIREANLPWFAVLRIPRVKGSHFRRLFVEIDVDPPDGGLSRIPRAVEGHPCASKRWGTFGLEPDIGDRYLRIGAALHPQHHI